MTLPSRSSNNFMKMAEYDKNEAFNSPMDVVFSWESPEDNSSKRKSQDDSGYVSPFSSLKRSTVENTPRQRSAGVTAMPQIARKRLVLTQTQGTRSELPSHMEGVASYADWDESLYSEPMDLDTPCHSNASQDDTKEALAAVELSKDLGATIASCIPLTPICSPIRKTTASDLVPATPRKMFIPKKRDVASAPTELWQRSKPRRNMTGTDKVDFLLHLGVKSSFPNITSKILGYLPDSDLSSVTMVSKIWKNVCSSDAKARERWIKYTDERKQNRENLNLKRVSSAKERKVSLGDYNQNHSTPFLERQPTSPPISPSRVRFNRFTKVSNSLKVDEVLVVCRKCGLPFACPTSTRFAECISPFCNFKFCRICKATFHPNRDCPALSPSTPTTPTKRYDVRKARRNLRRL